MSEVELVEVKPQRRCAFNYSRRLEHAVSWLLETTTQSSCRGRHRLPHKVRYCNRTCQMDHWRRGHKQICKEIHRGGNAEQYNADKKYKEAVAVAVEACADDTKGQTCYICTEAVHSRTGEGLVRGCACRGTSGFAHVSCLVEQAKVSVEQAERSNRGSNAVGMCALQYDHCRLCKQMYHGVVACALGWGAWKSNIHRPEKDRLRIYSMGNVAAGLHGVGKITDSLAIYKSVLSAQQRCGDDARCCANTMNAIAVCYADLGRTELALPMQRDAYNAQLVFVRAGVCHPDDPMAAVYGGVAESLIELGRFGEAKAFLPDVIAFSVSRHGANHVETLKLRWRLATSLYKCEGASISDCEEAVATLEDVIRISHRVCGTNHPTFSKAPIALESAREALARARARASNN